MEVEIIKLDNEGRGICYVNNLITFVRNALPNEIVKIKLIKETRKYNIGEVIEYIKKAPERKEAFCPYYGGCGGCDLEHLSYEDSVKFKKETLANILKKFAGIDTEVNFIASDKDTHYRNKISLRIEKGKIGFYEEETHDIVDITYCYLAKESINKIIPYLKVNNGSVLIRSNYNDEIIIEINSRDKIDLDIDELSKENKIVGIILNNKIIYGEDHFIERVGHMLFQVHSKSFFQVNLDIALKALEIIKKEVGKEDTVLDAYCGVGFLGLAVASKVKKVYGVEVVQSAILDALLNMKINKIENAKFMLGKSEDVLDNLPEDINAVIVDPPREGLKSNVKDFLLNRDINKIIYMSCNPFTLARDLKELKDKYIVEKVYGLDMFCYTKHIESIVILKKF